MLKRNFSESAAVFLQEASVPTDATPIDTSTGFLFEWWSIFWDVFSARASKQSTREASLYVERQQLRQQNRVPSQFASVTHTTPYMVQPQAGSSPAASAAAARTGPVIMSNAATAAVNAMMPASMASPSTEFFEPPLGLTVRFL